MLTSSRGSNGALSVLVTSVLASAACGKPPGPSPATLQAPTMATSAPTATPATPSPDVQVEVARPDALLSAPEDAAARAPSEEASASPDDDARPAVPAFPAGIIPAELGEGLILADAPNRIAHTLAMASECAAAKGPRPELDAPDPCAVPWLLGAVAFDADGTRAAFLSTKDAGGCAGGGQVAAEGFFGKAPELKPEKARRFPLTRDAEEEDVKLRTAIWRWLADLGKAGFATPAPDLIVAAAAVESGIRAASPLVRLGPPLDGMYLYAARAETGAKVQLVGADNKTTFALGTIADVSAKCAKSDREDGLCADGTAPSFVRVVLTPDRKTLLVTTTMGDGMHCGSDYVAHHAWAVPEALWPK